MDKVWSVTIKGKNDCVVMNDAEAMMIKMKYMPDIEMYDMTAKHGMKPQYLHKLQREQDSMPDGVTWTGDLPPSQTYIKGIGPGQFGGAAHIIWEFEDLINA